MAGVEFPASALETPDKAGEADLDPAKKLVVNSVAAALEKKVGPKLGAGAPGATAGATAAGGGAAVLGA